VSDVISRVLSGLFGQVHLALDISLRFLLETRLKSECFETLDDLLRFRVQKLWPENNKIIN